MLYQTQVHIHSEYGMVNAKRIILMEICHILQIEMAIIAIMMVFYTRITLIKNIIIDTIVNLN